MMIRSKTMPQEDEADYTLVSSAENITLTELGELMFALMEHQGLRLMRKDYTYSGEDGLVLEPERE